MSDDDEGDGSRWVVAVVLVGALLALLTLAGCGAFLLFGRASAATTTQSE